LIKSSKTYPILFAFILTALMCCIWWVFEHVFSAGIWADMTQSKSGLSGEYCEYDHKGNFFRQKYNTYSNLIYFFVGVFIILFTKYSVYSPAQVNRLQTFPALSFFMGACFIYLSFGSAFFHASLTYLGQRVDMNGTYGISIVLLAIGIYHVFAFEKFNKHYLLCIIILALIGFVFLAPLVSSGVVIPIIILSVLALKIITYFKFKKQHYLSLIGMSFFLILIAIKIRTRDVEKINCDPNAVLQGHAIWHVLTALSSFCSYAYFRFTKKDAIKKEVPISA
jgi:Ceramidase